MFRRILKPAVLCIVFFSGSADPSAGRQQRPKPETTVRVNVSLVQTDVTVFDGRGRFVSGLKPEQFELQVDGKRQQVSFCELVYSGTGRDAALWAARPANPQAPIRLEPPGSDAGHSVLFFVDDWHMSAESLMHLRAALLRLIDETIGVNDRAGIFAAAGGVGFLQQLSDSKAVLRAAAERLTFLNHPIEDKEPPAMKEWQALAIEQNNQDVISYFIDELIGGTRGARAIYNRATASYSQRFSAYPPRLGGSKRKYHSCVTGCATARELLLCGQKLMQSTCGTSWNRQPLI